jgi:hypothetical protein
VRLLAGLGLLVAAVLLVLLFRGETPHRLEVNPPRTQAAGGAPYAPAITDVPELVGRSDALGLIGQDVVFESVRVLSVLDDRNFFVGVGPRQRALVSFEPRPEDPDQPAPVAAGDSVAVRGIVRPLPTDPEGMARLGIDGLSPAERLDLGVYVEGRMVLSTFNRAGAR